MYEKFREKLQMQEKPRSLGFPEPGTVIVGELKNIRETRGSYGTKKILEIFDPDCGETHELLCTRVLENEIRRQGIVVGSIIGLKYFGKEKYHKWYVKRYDKEQNGTSS